jgi:transcriptional regulator with XRE-family HTH domain
MSEILSMIGKQLRQARRARALTQSGLAARLGRDRARISGFERELANNRMGRDRLTLLAEICGALGLVPVLVPRARAQEIEALVAEGGISAGRRAAPGAFDDLFVDLGDDDVALD